MANYERPPSPSSGNSFDPIHSGDASASLIQLETAERNDELEAGEEDDLLSDESADEGSPFMRNGRIDVGGPAWDESEDEDEAVLSDDDDPGAPLALSSSQRKRKRRAQRPDSYFATLRPSAAHRRICWRFLTSKGTPASLSAPHVCANLFAASLHPAVLLSMPHFFQRTGISLGVVGLIVVGILGGVGGGVWVVLGRYVGRSTVEAITGASFGKTTKWKGNIGKAVSGIMLAVYATGAAVIAYFALADLLLQVFFHYSPRGIPLHSRGFVTLVVGGLFTFPLLVFPSAKRTLIRLSTFLAVGLYPVLLAIMLAKVYTLDPHPDSPLDGLGTDPGSQLVLNQDNALGRFTCPNANPLHPPSIWAPFSLLPLLTLSSSPLQIMAHNRSLRRKGLSGSNVKAFMGAQAGQVFFIVGLSVAFGVGIGTKGIQDRLRAEIHPNLFSSLPNDDHFINLARMLFVLLLGSHLSLCLVTARSSYGRLLRLLHITGHRSRISLSFPSSASVASATGSSTDAPKKRWGKLARNSIAGVLLWALTASTAYFSGVGGIRRREKEGEEARFTRASEVLGLMGAGVGFVLPALVWILLFHVRRPRAILPLFASETGRSVSAYFLGPQSALVRSAPETQPLLAPDESTTAFRTSIDGATVPQTPTWMTEHASDETDEATTVLLARKERQLQRRTRGRRLWQDVLVLVGVLPFGVALLVLGALELSRGGW